MTVGERIAWHRQLIGMSVSDLAKQVGVTRITIYNYEHNLREPTLINAMCVADALGISLEYLARGRAVRNNERLSV